MKTIRISLVAFVLSAFGLQAQTNLSLSLEQDLINAVPGGPFSVTVRVVNQGPDRAVNATLTLLPPSQIEDVTWTCQSPGPDACQSTGGGWIQESVTLSSGAALVLTLQAKVKEDTHADITLHGFVDPPLSQSDTNLGDNQAQVTVPVLGLDYGDAPDARVTPVTHFPTGLAENGARHGVVPGVFLGAGISAKPNGPSHVLADGDPDDDGVVWVTPPALCRTAQVAVTASSVGFLDAWLDFNGDGDWLDSGEQIFVSQPLVAGQNLLSFEVGCDANPDQVLFSRFRFSSDGGLSFNGLALDGEVEDYGVSLTCPAADLSNQAGITAYDVAQLMKYHQGRPLSIDPFAPCMADMDCNGDIDQQDAMLLLQYLTQLIAEPGCMNLQAGR